MSVLDEQITIPNSKSEPDMVYVGQISDNSYIKYIDKTIHSQPLFKAGTYTVREIITKLANASHKHKGVINDSNCNCDCDSDSDSDSI